MAKKKSTKSKSKTSKARSIAKPVIPQTINTEVIAAALSSVNQPIFLKVCRLCESKDGPFLNIFDSEKVTAKKIEELMPFWVAENDDLPHKICFRCSAKVEELHEFVQRCIRTQENLRKALGKSEPLQVKTKTRALWEEKLNRSNMTNDDICDALIKKAMEGIKDLPKEPTPMKSDKPRTSSRLLKPADLKPESQKMQKSKNKENDDEDEDVTLKDIKSSKDDITNKSSYIRSTRRSTIETTQDKNQSSENESESLLTTRANKQQQSTAKNSPSEDKHAKNTSDDSTQKPNNSINKEEISKSNNDTTSKPFDIMDHVSMIKVNGVGILFQCKLCNRNFLKKEVVMSHACAKTGVPKLDICNMYMPPEPPKVTTVKYINTKVGGDDKFPTVNQKSPSDNNIPKSNTTAPTVKRKIGPASKIGRPVETSNTNSDEQESRSSNDSIIPTGNVQGLSNAKPAACHLPSAPNLNMRYKLLPGPNNTFTLVEDKSSTDERIHSESQPVKKNDPIEVINLEDSPDNRAKGSSRSKKSNINNRGPVRTIFNEQNSEPESTVEQPYPVGLFQTVPHHSSSFNQTNTTQVPFTTPAMKKQSYTVVQTGNPSKLLISTKPQQVEETKKRPKRAKPAPKNDTSTEEPFSVILEDTAPPKDPGFFSFINVDPLLQPSYVLPTDNIIQESQITTSTLAKRQTENKDKDNKYSCSICGEKFNREKKLNTHIYSHYNVDEDVQEERSRKRSRK